MTQHQARPITPASSLHTRCGLAILTVLTLTALPAAASNYADEVDFVADLPAVSADDLTATRGGATLITTSQTLSATATGNTVSATGDFATGNVSIGDNFGSGMGSYVMNTGANTAISSAMNVNVEIYPGSPP